MSTLTTRQRRNGLAFAEEVAELARRAPDGFAKSQLYQAVNSMRRQYGFSDVEKKNQIVKLLENGCSSYRDLINESRLPQQEVSSLVRELCEEGKARLIPMNGPTGGRPPQFIEAVTAKNGLLHP